MPVPSGEERPFVSVIVPVRNDAQRLAVCLRALEDQCYPADLFEVVLVDNGSDVPVAAARDAFPHCRVVNESEVGLSRARAAGVACARGEIFAFTDADCIPDRDWLAQGVACFLATSNCGLAGGRIEVFASDPAHAGVAETLSLVMHLQQQRFIEQGGWCVLANAFSSRAVVEAVGAMNAVFVAGGDEEWGLRIGAAGYRLVYAPEARVRHPARTSFRKLCERTVRIEAIWTELRAETGVGRGVRHWLGQYVRHPLASTYRDVLRNPRLSLLRRAQVAALSLFLMQVRLASYALMRAGARADVRKRWG